MEGGVTMRISDALLEKVSVFITGKQPVLCSVSEFSSGCVLCSSGCIGCDGSCEGCTGTCSGTCMETCIASGENVP